MNRSHVLSVAAAAWWSLCLVSPLRGELILDDFVQPAELSLPDMRFDSAVTEQAGFLGARRTLRAGVNHTTIGSLVAGGEGESLLVGVLGDSRPAQFGDLHDLTLDYYFSSFDATHGGANDAILLDFCRLDLGATRASLSIFAGGRPSAHVRTLPSRTSPFTLAIPFDSFRLAPELKPFNKLADLHFRFRAFPPDVAGDLGFRLELDRIRIGRVPEPAAGNLAVLGVAVGVSWIRARRRGRSVASCS